VREGSLDDDLVSWRAFAFASRDTIERLLHIYMDVVYPIYPLFHGPTLWERIRNRDHLSDRGFFASVMGACALASARARDGALIQDSELPKHELDKQSEIFLSGAACAIYKDFNKAQGLGYLRACGLLAMTAIQYGQIATMHQYLGHFCTLSAMQQFHDENHWPRTMAMTEKEECRRLYWSMYNLDVLAAVVFNGVLKFQEMSLNVQYPSEVDDDQITPTSCLSTPEGNWLRGWNVTTDMFRVLEHTVKRVQSSQQISRMDRSHVLQLLVPDRFNSTLVMEGVLRLYHQLPERFRDYSVGATGNVADDFYGFQAVNIQATFQLVRMTLFSVDTDHDVHQKCAVAEELMASLRSICPRFLTSISAPFVYQLGGVGHILATIMEGSLTEDSYQRVRSSLVSMVELLEGLESDLQPTAGASKGLRAQVEKIDQNMQTQRSSSAYGPQMPNHSSTAATYSLEQRSAYQQQQQRPPLGHAVNGFLTGSDQFQAPQDSVGPWPWPPFESQSNPSHPSSSTQRFGGGETGS
jgi:hypothetical protein